MNEFTDNNSLQSTIIVKAKRLVSEQSSGDFSGLLANLKVKGLTMNCNNHLNHHVRSKNSNKLSGYSRAIHEHMGELFLAYTLTKGIQDGRSIMCKVNIPLNNFNPATGASRLKAARHGLKNLMATLGESQVKPTEIH